MYKEGPKTFIVTVKPPLGDLKVSFGDETFENGEMYEVPYMEVVNISAANANKLTIEKFNEENQTYNVIQEINSDTYDWTPVETATYKITAFGINEQQKILKVDLLIEIPKQTYNPQFSNITIKEFQTTEISLGTLFPSDLLIDLAEENDKSLITLNDDYLETGVLKITVGELPENADPTVTDHTVTIQYLWLGDDSRFEPFPEDEDYRSFTVTVKEKDRIPYEPPFMDEMLEIDGVRTLTIPIQSSYQFDLGESHPTEILFEPTKSESPDGIAYFNDDAGIDDCLNGLLTINDIGQTTIKCAWTRDISYKRGDITFVLVVEGKTFIPAFVNDETIVKSDDGSYGLSLMTGQKHTLSLGDNVPSNVSFASSAPDVATVGNDGVISAVATGTATITCSWPEDVDNNFKAGNITITLTVQKAPKVVTYSYTDELTDTEKNATSSQNKSVDGKITTVNGVSFSWNLGTASNTNNPKCYYGSTAANNSVRLYNGNTVTISAPGYNIESVVFTETSGSSTIDKLVCSDDKLGTLSTNDKNRTWNANQNVGSVTFKHTGNVTRIASIKVTLKKGDPVEVAMAWKDKGGNAVESLSTAINADLTGFFPELEVSVADAKSAVVYSSTNEDVATIAADGNITLVGVGETTITASIPEGNDTFLPVQAEYTLTVTEAEKHDYEAPFAGKTYDLTTDDSAVALDLGTRHPEKIAFKTSDANVAEVITEEDESGERKAYIKINGVGSAVITASWGVDDNYSASSLEAPVTFTVNVTKVVGPKTVTFDVSALKKVEYNGDNTEATGGNQQVTLLWAKKSQTAALTQNFTQSPSDVRLYKNNELKISVGDNFYIERIEFTTESSNKLTDDTNVDVGTIDVSGQLWKNVDADNNEVEPSAVTFVCGAQIRMTRIKVIYHPRGAKPVTMEWSAEAVEFALNAELESKLPVLTVNPEKALSYITYSIEKAEDAEGEVASIDPVTGEIKLLSVGVATVTASTDGEVYEAASASYTLTVTPKVAMKYEPTWASLAESGLALSTATDLYDLELGKKFPADIDFSSSDENVATVTIVDGIVEIKVRHLGETEIVFQWGDSEDFESGEIKFTLTVSRELQAVVLVHTSKSYTGSIVDVVRDNEVPSTIPGIATFNYSKGACKEDFRIYKGESFSITSKNGITLVKVVAAYKANGTPVITVAEENGTVSVKDGFITWEGETTDGFTLHTDFLVQLSYIEIYYYEEGLDPDKTKVDLDWGVNEATAVIGEEFIAPQLSVKVVRPDKLEAAKAAVRYRSEFPEVAQIDELTGEITIIAEGETHITAYIPSEDETFAANAEVFNLIVDDPYTIVLNSTSFKNPSSYNAVTYVDASRKVTYSGVLMEVKEGTNAYIQLNPSNSNGKASSIVVSTNTDNVIIESVAIKFDGSTDPTTVAGLNIYGDDNCFTAPVKAASSEYKVDDSLKINDEEIKESQTITINKTAFAIVPAESKYQRIYSITVRYSDKTVETIEAVTLGHEETDIKPAQVHNGVEVDEASVFVMEDVVIASNSAAVVFEYEGVSWIVPTVDGKAAFTASYLPAPKKDSTMEYYGVDDNGNRTTAKRAVAIDCGHQFYEPYSYTNEGQKLIARFDDDKERWHLFLDLEITHKMTHANADNRKAPHVIAYNVSSENHASKTLEYVRGTGGIHTATIKEFIDIPVRSDITHSQVLDLLNNFEFTDEHNFEASAQVYYPVMVASEPVVTMVNPAFFAGRKSFKAAPAVQMVAGNGNAADDNTTTSTVSVSKDDLVMPVSGGIVTGLENVLVEAEEAEAEYFNLQGVKIAHPAKGQVVIRRQGSKVEKMVIK